MTGTRPVFPPTLDWLGNMGRCAQFLEYSSAWLIAQAPVKQRGQVRYQVKRLSTFSKPQRTEVRRGFFSELQNSCW